MPSKPNFEEQMNYNAPVKKPNFLVAFLSGIKSLFSRFFLEQKRPTQVLSVLALIGIVTAVFFFIKFNELKKNPSAVVDQQTRDLVKRVSKLIVLPENEVPTMATVSDPEKLKDQPFFINAKKGYNVLIYSNAKKAILYDPFSNKIIEVAPINIGGTSLDSTAVPSSPK